MMNGNSANFDRRLAKLEIESPRVFFLSGLIEQPFFCQHNTEKYLLVD
jgi:hypothetical protein